MPRVRAAHAAALAAILISGTVGLFWVFLIPIFQSPDEPAHFDYAVSIYNARRLVSRADGPSDWIVSPYTKYLLQTSDFNRIAGHSPMRVAPDYRSASFDARVNASAPDLHRPLPSNGRVNYIVRLYPFGFYALEAVWMAAAVAVTHSILGLFFGARILCVLLTMAALYFSYRAALNIGVPPWTAAILTGAVGLFPMTSMVSSYVQPDNLAFALVSAAIFFATQLRLERPTAARAMPLGIVLGLLAVTKYQFFLTTAIPIALLAGVELHRSKANAVRLSVAAICLAFPAIALLSIQHIAVDAATQVDRIAPGDINSLFARGVLAQGFGHALSYAALSLFQAFWGCFVSGICAAGYWQALGWGETAIVIGSPSAQIGIRVVISLITLIVAVVVVFQFARNGVELGSAAARRHAHAALRVASSDPFINSYLCFILLIFALYVLTNNTFGLSGRHWYPYVFAAFLCFVWYAPRAFVRRRERVSTILACVLLAYSIIANLFAISAIDRRYYAPQTASYVLLAPRAPEGAEKATGVLWPVQNGTYIFAAQPGEFDFPRGTPVAVSGAALERSGIGASRVAILLDYNAPIGVLARQYLFGIAEATHNIAAGYSGFGGYVSTASLRQGPHVVAAWAQTGGNGSYQFVAPARLFFVTGQDGTLSQSFARALPRGAGTGTVDSVETCLGSVTFTGRSAVTAAGSVLLVRGRLDAKVRGTRSAVWLLAGGRPYPAKTDGEHGSFYATLPTARLATGRHVASLYLANFASRKQSLVGDFTLFVLPSRVPRFLHDPPQGCSDPLKELAQK